MRAGQRRSASRALITREFSANEFTAYGWCHGAARMPGTSHIDSPS
ncbi:hypothetical protein LWC35_09230 [Pseudonocardia kujensis]|nr:hypothetical protein [Pseudonocardia kujensis]MCE0763091.1 hypothetical protein [Pseudonocardia kujensis]